MSDWSYPFARPGALLARLPSLRPALLTVLTLMMPLGEARADVQTFYDSSFRASSWTTVRDSGYDRFARVVEAAVLRARVVLVANNHYSLDLLSLGEETVSLSFPVGECDSELVDVIAESLTTGRAIVRRAIQMPETLPVVHLDQAIQPEIGRQGQQLAQAVQVRIARDLAH